MRLSLLISFGASITTGVVATGIPVPLYGQCGGYGLSVLPCVDGAACTVINSYYFQCLPPSPGVTTTASSSPTSTSKSGPSSTCSGPAPTMTGGSPIYASSSSTKGLQLDNVNGAAVVKTSGSLYWTYSATGSSLSTLNYINRCKVVKYLNVEESSPYSYKPLSFGDTPSTTYWSLTKGGNLKTTANSPYGVVSDFVVCGGPQWKVYLQTGTDLPSSQTGQYCETTTLTLQ